MNGGNTTLLSLIRAEQERRRTQAPSHVILIRWNKTDDEWAEEIEAKRRSGEIGPNTVVTEVLWQGPPLHKKLV